MTTVTTIDVLSGARSMQVRTAGSGPALVYLHPEESADWNSLLDELAESFTVYAPNLALTEDALSEIDTLHDILVVLLDVVDELGLDSFALAGESFGGMLAAELTAIAGHRVTHLVLAAPLGLWRDDEQVPELYAIPADIQVARLFGDTSSEVAAAWLAGQVDPAARLARMRSMRTALHIVFPIPEIGLHRRLHRVLVPTLLLWGSNDGIVPPSYANDFAELIESTTTTVVDGAGHVLSIENPGAVAAALRKFLS